MISRVTQATQANTAAKVRKAKQELPELQVHEWVGLRLICKHFNGNWYSSLLKMQLLSMYIRCAWLVILSDFLLSVKGSEGPRGPAGTKVSSLSASVYLTVTNYETFDFLYDLFIYFFFHF